MLQGIVLIFDIINILPQVLPLARLVVVLAGGTGMKEADKQKFLNSVKIGKGK